MNALEDVEREHLLELLGGLPNCSAELKADGSVRFERLAPAVHGTKLSTEQVFANSILGPSYNYPTPAIELEGAPIPRDVLRAIDALTEKESQAIAWENGDVVLIDNSRVMHGRREILDTRRKLVTALSML